MSTNEVQAVPSLNTPLVDLQTGLVAIPWYRFFITLWNRTGAAQGGTTIQSGGMIWWFEATPPDGYFLCDGTAVSRTQNPDLFAAIGTTFGAGDGVNTFNLPNVTDRVIIGAGGTYAIGATGGATSVTLTIGQLPAHDHVLTDPGHSHGQQVVSNNTAGVAGTQGANAANTTTIGTTDLAFTGITMATTGSNDPIDITPPYLALYLIIKQ